MGRKRILTEIIKTFEQQGCDNFEICSNKSRGWNLLDKLKIAPDKLAQKTIEIMDKCCKVKLYPPSDFNPEYIKQEFSISWRDKEKVKSKEALIGVTENNLETFIMLANKTNENDIWINQVPVPNGHIDICRSHKGQLYIYELKIWNNGKNTPIYSILEAIKNYKLLPAKENEKTLATFKINIDEYKDVNLIILAPAEYFIGYKTRNSIKIFFEYKKALETELNKRYDKIFKIRLQAINFKQEEYKQFCNNLINAINEKEPNKLHKGMKEITGQKWENYFNILPKTTRENLNFKKWIEIKDISDWLNLKI